MHVYVHVHVCMLWCLVLVYVRIFCVQPARNTHRHVFMYIYIHAYIAHSYIHIIHTHMQAEQAHSKQLDKSKVRDVCVRCSKTAADEGLRKLLKCSACTIAPLYCSTACQKACWKEHKAECKANRK
jgi:hypothetical protein